MRPRPRRALLFVAMVGTGLAAAYLLSDPFTGRQRAAVGELQDDGKDGRIRVADRQGESATTVLLGRVEFEMTEEVQLGPGRTEERVVYRVRIASGRPDDEGNILAEEPLITVLDRRTGRANGTLRADEARFQTDGAVGGQVTVDFGRIRAQDFSLTGGVRGEFTMSDGEPASFEAEKMLVHDGLVTAPGRVRWSRPDLSLDGVDMTWDEATGALDLRTDAHLELAPAGGRPGYAFAAPAGLSAVMPPAGAPASERTRAELRGPVTGTSTDGGRLAADTLHVDADTGLVSLEGSSLFERETEAGVDRLTAQNVSVRADDEGRIRIAEADGGVRLVHAPVALMPASLATESLRVVEDVAHAPGRVTWDRADLHASGRVMDWDLKAGALRFEQDAEIALAKEADHPLAGLRLVAPGGMSWTLPPGATDALAAASGRMEGGVTGSLPDGTTMSADVMLFDGPAGTFRLEGSAAYREERDEAVSRLDADRVTVRTGGDGRIALLTAEGDVIVVSGPVDVLPTRLEAERVEREQGRLRSDGRVTWTRGGLTVAGTGMTVDEADGRLEFARDAQLTMRDEAGATTMEVRAEGGLVWQAPPGATDPRAEGRGTLRGPVHGRTSEGFELAAELATIDGAQGRLELSGGATIASDDGLALASDRIALVSRDDARRVEIPGPARWTLPDARGEGTGLSWDDAQGRLTVERDVYLLLAAAPGAAPWELTADGRLEWTRRADAPDGAPLRGLGEVRGHVQGRHPTDGSFLTERLLLDGVARHISLRGPSSWTAGEGGSGTGGADGRGLSLQATTRIDLQSGADGAARSVLAEGEAVARLSPRDGSAPVLSAGRITLDEASRTIELEGDVLAEGLDADGGSRVRAGERLVARFDAQDALLSVQASGRVTFERGFLVECDELAWDVPGDEALLRGDCLLRQGGVAMRCEQIEVRPRERAFRILRSSVQVDG